MSLSDRISDSRDRSYTQGWKWPIAAILLGAIALSGCSQANKAKITTGAAPAEVEAYRGDEMQMAQGNQVQSEAPAAVEAAEATAIAQAPPQLIKTAAMTVKVEKIDGAIEAVSQIIRQQRGDILNFEDNKPVSSNTSHLASMQLRVPQQQLENTINAIAELGTVLNRSISAEDVSNQLIDNDARLRNLRKQEEMVLKIMDRSGSVGDVLNAARELGNIREQIERLDAVQKNLRNQVAYSTIYLNLQAPVSAAEVVEPSLGSQLQETWTDATDAFQSLGVGLLKLTIYLLVFSPFLFVFGGIWGYRHWRRGRDLQPPATGGTAEESR
ncbi:DUF4349 domain-containing protein [Oxynema sp. CENA135]|uniref:DUF4349 domain-containing protein n=1 Tax=Oxynema sp. CENA135 TaxID=984206 RepID=UPI00190BD4EA|nr:DUF4349 domain-containing protein [Oxynema sp. CENA135]MBK4731914.1 DUF4349 domain-containing protein [Oxynema sp. CENA135]